MIHGNLDSRGTMGPDHRPAVSCHNLDWTATQLPQRPSAQIPPAPSLTRLLTL
jgi:hypothetical protein